MRPTVLLIFSGLVLVLVPARLTVRPLLHTYTHQKVFFAELTGSKIMSLEHTRNYLTTLCPCGFDWMDTYDGGYNNNRNYSLNCW
jgi:hypothetical protein